MVSPSTTRLVLVGGPRDGDQVTVRLPLPRYLCFGVSVPPLRERWGDVPAPDVVARYDVIRKDLGAAFFTGYQ